ncbi:MAG: hypothetical protein FJ151_02685, partial [Euryarchaeota archaeon]|nr:hypothetical protein [Euryarchaeota archaeon]
MTNPPGRPDLGKSKTIKERTVYLYVPTKDMLDEWKREAGRHGLSLSRFLVEVIDDAVRRSPEGITPRERIKEELQRASSELNSLREEREALRFQLEGTEKQLANYRESLCALAEASKDDALLGRIVALFRRRRVWKLDEIPKALGIDIADAEAMGKLQTGIAYLRKIGLVEGEFEELRCGIGARRKKPRLSPEARRKKAA